MFFYRLATAPKACRIYHEWIKEALKETDWLTIGKMLKVLDHLPLETSTLVEYKLGKAVNIVQRKAASHGKIYITRPVFSICRYMKCLSINQFI